MSDQLRGICLAIAITVWASGCSRKDTAGEPPTPSARTSAQSVYDPLSEAEVQLFLSVLETLPNHQAPEFRPLAQVTASERLTARQLVEVYRQEYREMFNAAKHGEHWRTDERLMSTLDQHSISPEDFAALMIRMSFAIAASTISPDVNLSEVSTKADAHVHELVAEIDQLGTTTPTQAAVDYRLQALESLQNFVAFSEFTRILMNVPATSCAVVARHRAQLAGHLPSAGNGEQFERTIESHIVPTNFQQSPDGN